MRAGCLGLKHCEGSAWRTKFFCICVNMGAYNYHSPKISKFSKRGQMVRRIPGKSSRKYGNCWVSEKRTFNRKFRKFQDESQMGRKFPGKFFRKFGYTSRGCSLLWNLCKFPIFYSALASSFSRDHSELDVSREDDAHSIKETLKNLSTYKLCR